MATSRRAVPWLALLILAFACSAFAAITERVSVNAAGDEANGASHDPCASADGRFVAFWSYAANLVSGDTNNRGDVFVYDRTTGAVQRVSVSTYGEEGDNLSLYPSISADGRFIAFRSQATNLVPGDANGRFDIFVYDRETGGCERVSLNSEGEEPYYDSENGAISADGRYVAFDNCATNLVVEAGVSFEEPDIWPHVFVRDREAEVTQRASVNSSGEAGDWCSHSASLSADGRYVAFVSWAANLVSGDTNEVADVFLHDRETGATERVSVSSEEAEGDGESGPWPAAISADGRYVAFGSSAANLVPADTNEVADVFVRDRETGITERVSVATDGTQANASSGEHGVSMTADGRYVTFGSSASSLVLNDMNEATDVFIHDRQTGATERVSLSSLGAEANADSGYFGPAISANGSVVVFESIATDLVPDDTNGVRDVFVRDRWPPAEVLLEAHPNERAQGPGAGPKLGGPPWQPSGLGPGTWCEWKVYEFDGSAHLWIQVCAQNFNSNQNLVGARDRLQMVIDGQIPSDLWGLMTGVPGVCQWNGDSDNGDRLTLEFRPAGLTAGKHTLVFWADETPIIWWVKVIDLSAPQTE